MKLNKVSIRCFSIEEKTKVLLVLLINHAWRSGCKEILPSDMTEDSFKHAIHVNVDSRGRIFQTQEYHSQWNRGYSERTVEDILNT